MYRLLVVALLFVSVAAAKPHKRHLYTPTALPGSYESMVRQNAEINNLQLPRIVDDRQLEVLEYTGELVPIQGTYSLIVNPKIQANKRYCRPWTRQFLYDISSDYYQRFKQPMIVTSAVRTIEQQHKLRYHNRNAAPDYGDVSSSHLAGITVDIARGGMTKAQRKWTEDYLKDLRDKGLVEVAEERGQLCFHVMVSNRYGME